MNVLPLLSLRTRSQPLMLMCPWLCTNLYNCELLSQPGQGMSVVSKDISRFSLLSSLPLMSTADYLMCSQNCFVGPHCSYSLISCSLIFYNPLRLPRSLWNSHNSTWELSFTQKHLYYLRPSFFLNIPQHCFLHLYLLCVGCWRGDSWSGNCPEIQKSPPRVSSFLEFTPKAKPEG